MLNNIIKEIRLMRKDYINKYREWPKIIYFDSVAESKLTTFLIDQYKKSKKCAFLTEANYNKLLKEGIRSLGDFQIYGMNIKFGCSLFGIEYKTKGQHADIVIFDKFASVNDNDLK